MSGNLLLNVLCACAQQKEYSVAFILASAECYPNYLFDNLYSFFAARHTSLNQGAKDLCCLLGFAADFNCCLITTPQPIASFSRYCSTYINNVSISSACCLTTASSPSANAVLSVCCYHARHEVL